MDVDVFVLRVRHGRTATWKGQRTWMSSSCSW